MSKDEIDLILKFKTRARDAKETDEHFDTAPKSASASVNLTTTYEPWEALVSWHYFVT